MSVSLAKAPFLLYSSFFALDKGYLVTRLMSSEGCLLISVISLITTFEFDEISFKNCSYR